MYFYHLTRPENAEPILASGLKAGSYLTPDWEDLIASGTIPELTAGYDLVLLRVDATGVALKDDPEYDLDPDLAQIAETAIPEHRVKLLCGLRYAGRLGTTPKYDKVSDL